MSIFVSIASYRDPQRRKHTVKRWIATAPFWRVDQVARAELAALEEL